MLLAVLRVLLAASLAVSSAGADDGCGGVLTSRAGTIQTPGFPRPFDVPVSCRWVVDSSSVPEETTIVVYLTQLFVTSGLRFTEYTYYEPESSFQLNPRLIYEVTEDDVITTKWVLTRTRYFVIEFNLERLEGNHLRVLDDLLDVYGFNITYEMRTEPSTSAASPEPRNDSCSVLTCSLAGNCYVSEDYSLDIRVVGTLDNQAIITAGGAEYVVCYVDSTHIVRRENLDRHRRKCPRQTEYASVRNFRIIHPESTEWWD